jgi:2-haloacid dehalogenase
MQTVISGDRRYVDLDVLHRENLDDALSETDFPFSLTDAELRFLVDAWHRLKPWPDSVAGLRRLSSGHIVGPLSNRHTAPLVERAKHSGLPWDVIIGSDITRNYKPDPAAYWGAAALLKLDPGEIMLVSAHNDDLGAARMAGLTTAFIARPHEYSPGQSVDLEPESDWDLVAHDIGQLALQLSGLSGPAGPGSTIS